MHDGNAPASPAADSSELSPGDFKSFGDGVNRGLLQAEGPSLRAAASEALLAGALVLAEINAVELRSDWKKKPETARLLAALEGLREALS